MTKRQFYLRIALVVGIVLVVNLLAYQAFFRVDLTADQQYTLSNATRTILEDLEDPVTVTGYFSEDLPPNIAQVRTEFRDLLAEYATRSDGMVVYEFVNPNEDEEAELEAMQNGISPVLIDVRERDQMTQRRAFLGARVQLGEQTEVIPFLQPGAAMEYALSTSIKKLAVVDKPSVAILQGHGEPSLTELQQVNTSLGVLYNVESLTFDEEAPTIPDRFNTAVLIAPTDSLPEPHLAAIDTFLARGGNLLVALNRVEGNFSNAYGQPVTTGLETWLRAKGITVDAAFVVDAQCGSVGVQQQQGPFRFNNNVAFPYFPIVSAFAEHPIVEGLEAIILQFASPITFTGDSTLTYTPIAQTSDRSGTQAAPVFFDINRTWDEADFPQQNLAVGAVVEGPLVGDTPARLVVLSDGDFAVNFNGQPVQPDNVSLMVNSIDWLSDDTGLIELRTKGITARPLDQLDDGTQTFLKYLNFLLPILLIVLYGVLRAQRRRSVRVQRMEERYV